MSERDDFEIDPDDYMFDFDSEMDRENVERVTVTYVDGDPLADARDAFGVDPQDWR